MIARALAGLLLVGPAWAQQGVEARSPAFQLEHFEPQGDPDHNILNVAGADVRGHLSPSAGALCHHAEQPLIVDPTTGADQQAVAGQTRCEALVSLGLFDLAQIDVALPVIVGQDSPDPEVFDLQRSNFGRTLGDLRVTPKLRLFPRIAGLGAALQTPIYLPTGDGTSFNSGGGLRLETRLITDWRLGPWQVAANLGYQLQNPLRLHNVTLDDAIRWAGGVRAPTGISGLRLFGTVFGSISTGEGRDPLRLDRPLEDLRDDPAELLAGLEYRLPGGLLARIGGGTGLSVGLGAPQWRALAAVDWIGPARDFAVDAWGDRADALTRLRLTVFAPTFTGVGPLALRRRGVPGPDAIFSVDSASVGRPADLTFGLQIGQAAARGVDAGKQVLLAASAAMAVLDDVELAVEVPGAFGDLAGSGALGDVALRLKALAVDGAEHVFGAGLTVPLVLPTATLPAFSTERVRVGTVGVGEVHLGRHDLRTNLGVHLEDDLDGAIPLGALLELGLAENWRFTDRWGLGVEVFAEHPLDALDRPRVYGTATTVERRGAGTTWALGTQVARYPNAITQVDLLLRGTWQPEPPRPPPPVVLAPPPAPPPPATDLDGDGIAGAADACPLAAEDHDGFEDGDGCPELDNDQDGVADGRDWCPNENGIRQWEGCNGLDVAVPFPFRAATPSPQARPVLAEMAAIILEHPRVDYVVVEGHTDDRGGQAFNQRLSETRAEAVREALIRAGVPAHRVRAVGRGEAEPKAAIEALTGARLAAARAQNRRVHFRLVRRPARADLARSGPDG